MRIFSLIVACSENRIIGKAGKLPWIIPEDRAYFRSKTAGQIVIMGRICFDAWKDATDLNRRVFVLTKTPLPQGSKATAVSKLTEALDLASKLSGEIFICGGESIYDEALNHPKAEKLYLTLIHKNFDGDRVFPAWKTRFSKELESHKGSYNGLEYTFLTLSKG
jgi:dihydrofolate reductase